MEFRPGGTLYLFSCATRGTFELSLGLISYAPGSSSFPEFDLRAVPGVPAHVPRLLRIWLDLLLAYRLQFTMPSRDKVQGNSDSGFGEGL